MKVSVLAGSAAALLLAGFPTTQGAPVDLIESRDFSANSGHWYQLQQLMHNIRSRIGVPFSAMRNVGLGYHQTLEIDPLDLVLLPNGYCYSCATAPHSEPNEFKRPNPFHNEMVELDETQLLVACTGPDDARSAEWPLMKACPGQERILRDFLMDLTSDGSRLAVPKARLENAPVFNINKHTCIPKDPKQTTCASPSPSMSASPTSQLLASETGTITKLRHLNVPQFAASIYSHKALSNTAGSPATASIGSEKLASKGAVAISVTSLPASEKAEATLASNSSNQPNELPTFTSMKEEITPTPTLTIPNFATHDRLPRPTVIREISAAATSTPTASAKPNETPASTSPKEDITSDPTSAVPTSTKSNGLIKLTSSPQQAAKKGISATPTTITRGTTEYDRSTTPNSTV
jgi:hypothetical protein